MISFLTTPTTDKKIAEQNRKEIVLNTVNVNKNLEKFLVYVYRSCNVTLIKTNNL